MPDEFYNLDAIKANFNGPEMVFCDNIRGFFSLAVKIRNRGTYGHFMWRIGPDRLASQWFYFKEFHLDHFAGCNMKFVSNPSWTMRQKEILTNAILIDLAIPWYKTLYDVPAVIGQLIGLDWLQLKKNRICSECINYLALVDPEAKEWLKIEHTPTPTDANLFCKSRPDRYKVVRRYGPD